MRLAVRGSRGLEYVTEVSDDLRDQAEILLRLIASKEPEANDSGARVRLDWGIVKLVRRGSEVLVEEPDYRRDPLRFIRGLTFTCAVLRAQQRVHDRLKVAAEPVGYDELVLVYLEGLSAARVAATRQASERPGDTGWRVFAANRIDWGAQFGARRVYDVPRERPGLMAVLSLPVGWSVRLEGDTLTEAATPKGERVVVGMALEV